MYVGVCVRVFMSEDTSTQAKSSRADPCACQTCLPFMKGEDYNVSCERLTVPFPLTGYSTF